MPSLGRAWRGRFTCACRCIDLRLDCPVRLDPGTGNDGLAAFRHCALAAFARCAKHLCHRLARRRALSPITWTISAQNCLLRRRCAYSFLGPVTCTRGRGRPHRRLFRRRCHRAGSLPAPASVASLAFPADHRDGKMNFVRRAVSVAARLWQSGSGGSGILPPPGGGLTKYRQARGDGGK